MGTEDVVIKGPNLRERVANAIYGVAVQAARKRFDEYDFQLDRLRRVFGLLDHETDRSLAIVLFALCEDLMLCSLKFNMRGNAKGGWDEVTSGNGVLATANDRITILELLGWIRPQSAEHLRLLKSIRNRFAHHADVNDFAENKIRGWLSSMEALEKPIADAVEVSRGPLKRKHTPRELFLMRAVLGIVALLHDLSVNPAAIAQHVHPADVSGRNYDEAPEPLKELRRIAADVILRTCFEQRRT